MKIGFVGIFRVMDDTDFEIDTADEELLTKLRKPRGRPRKAKSTPAPTGEPQPEKARPKRARPKKTQPAAPVPAPQIVPAVDDTPRIPKVRDLLKNDPAIAELAEEAAKEAKSLGPSAYSPAIAKLFCEVLARTCQVQVAAAAVGVSHMAIHRWRRKYPEFEAQFAEAIERGVMAMEDEVKRRAFEGVEKPVYQKGMLVGTTREYSDTLAIFLLKAHAPDKYRDRYEVNANVTLDLANAILDARKRLGKVEDKS